jgi:WhiB family redox-sensing transcriptional regulator
VTDYDDYSLDDEERGPFDEPSAKSADVIDIRKVLIDGLAADAADDDAIVGRSPQDLDWQDDGLCKESDPEAFFPEKGGSTKQAKAVCKRCPITEECLQYALENNERYGIWGGQSEHQRRQILKRLNDDMAAAGLGRAG